MPMVKKDVKKDPVTNMIEAFQEIVKTTDDAIKETLEEYCKQGQVPRPREFYEKVSGNLRKRLEQ